MKQYFQETYFDENPQKYESTQDLTEEEQKKREKSHFYRLQLVHIPILTLFHYRINMSHEEIGRTDRIYLSEDIFPEANHTRTTYYGIFAPFNNLKFVRHYIEWKHRIVEIVRGKRGRKMRDWRS